MFHFFERYNIWLPEGEKDGCEYLPGGVGSESEIFKEFFIITIKTKVKIKKEKDTSDLCF